MQASVENAIIVPVVKSLRNSQLSNNACELTSSDKLAIRVKETRNVSIVYFSWTGPWKPSSWSLGPFPFKSRGNVSEYIQQDRGGCQRYRSKGLLIAIIHSGGRYACVLSKIMRAEENLSYGTTRSKFAKALMQKSCQTSKKVTRQCVCMDQPYTMTSV